MLPSPSSCKRAFFPSYALLSLSKTTTSMRSMIHLLSALLNFYAKILKLSGHRQPCPFWPITAEASDSGRPGGVDPVSRSQLALRAVCRSWSGHDGTQGIENRPRATRLSPSMDNEND